MSKKKYEKSTIINDIQKDLDYPHLKVNLNPEEVEFLETYAEKRKDYTDADFNLEDGRTVRRILDKLVFAHVALYEKTEYDYTTMVNGLQLHSSTFRDRKQKVQELGDKVHAGLRSDWTRRDTSESE